jgi:hypothetical protein
MRTSTFGLLVLLMVTVTGCTKKECEITCNNPALSRTEDGGCAQYIPQLVFQGCSAKEKETGPFD